MNHRNLGPSDEELRRRLQSFMQAEIAAQEQTADEATVRRELEQITGMLGEQNDHQAVHPSTTVVAAQQPTDPPARQAEHRGSVIKPSRFAPQRSAPSGFWNDLDETERHALREAGRSRLFATGMHLCYEGDPSDYVIVIENGWAKVTSTTEDGHDVVLAVRGPGDLIDESAGPGHRQRSATVTALSPLHALLVPAGRFKTFLDTHPRARWMVSGTFVRRIDDHDRRLRAQASADGARRLALLLIDLAENYGTPGPAGSIVIQPPLSQSELASWVDSSRETVARALKVWQTHGLVDTARRKITVLNPGGLRAYADNPVASEGPPHARMERKIRTGKELRRPTETAITRTFRPAPATRRAQHCVIFAVDVAGFTDDKRDDEVQLAVRNAMYGVVIDAFNGAHLPWDECLHEDRGDGILVIIPAKMPSATVVDPLFDRVRAGLRRHNRMASDAAAIQLRAAVHIGEVYSDAHGLAGTAVNHLCRLLDAPVFKQALADSGADIGLIVSDYYFESVVKPGPGMIDPDTFHPVPVEVKRTRTHGWIHLPGAVPALTTAPTAPLSAADPRDLYDLSQQPPASAPTQNFIFFGPTTIHGHAVAAIKTATSDSPQLDAREPVGARTGAIVTEDDLGDMEFDTLRTGDHVAAAQRLSELAGSVSGGVSRAKVLLRAGEQWQHAGDHEKAAELYRQAIEDGGEVYGDPRAYLADALYELGRADEARALIEEIRVDAPRDPEVHRCVSELLYAHGDLAGAHEWATAGANVALSRRDPDAAAPQGSDPEAMSAEDSLEALLRLRYRARLDLGQPEDDYDAMLDNPPKT